MSDEYEVQMTPATAADVQRGFDTNALEQQMRGVTYGIADVGYAMNNAVTNAKDCIENGVGGVKDAVIAEGRGIQAHLASINCNIANKFAEMQKSMLEQKIADQSQQITQLQMSNMLNGIPRINPNGWDIWHCDHHRHRHFDD